MFVIEWCAIAKRQRREGGLVIPLAFANSVRCQG